MPWKEWNVMDERVKFIARFPKNERVADLARRGIARRALRPRAWPMFARSPATMTRTDAQ